MFANREEAGYLLANKLITFKDREDVITVAIPRGGVPIGYIIAKTLKTPLEMVLSKKIGHPYNSEFAIGAVTLKNRILSDAANEVSMTYIDNETEHIRDILKQRHKWYYGNSFPISLENKIIILVDDGTATGNTIISCIQLIEQDRPSKLIVALPVAPQTALNKINKLISIKDIICLNTPDNFLSVGQFYKNFTQVNDEEVIKLFKEANENQI
jgi:predicted phosphoribosyltransferase